MRATLDFRSLRERTVTPLDDDCGVQLKGAVLKRHSRHRVRVRAMGVVGACATLGVLIFALTVAVRPFATERATTAVQPSITSAASTFGGYVGPDGSRVTFLTIDTELVQAGAPRQSTLVRGSARFDVVHDNASPFRVVAGPVVVQDVGTVFTVRLVTEKATEVSVESGQVEVTWASGSQHLSMGEGGVFPPTATMPSQSVSASPSNSAAETASQPDAWHQLARSGDMARAYAELQKQGGRVKTDGESLLLAADAARGSGHPAEAVGYLRRLIASLPGDVRVGVAAFTLGRILLDELGKPQEAADAFAIAYARGGPLAEDALGRQVDAWLAAGAQAKARKLAENYVATFPKGRRVTAMKRIANGI